MLQILAIFALIGVANLSQAKAVEQIKKLGGTVTLNEKSSDKPVVAVDLHNPPPDPNARTILEKAKQALQYKVVTDDTLRDLQGLTTLQSLNLGRTLVADAGLERLEGLTQLQSLDLGETKVTDEGLKHLGRLTRLQTLVLYKTNMTDAGLEHLEKLPHLHSLDLVGTKVSDDGLSHLKNFPKLQSLALPAAVTDAGLEHLNGSRTLRAYAWEILG